MIDRPEEAIEKMLAGLRDAEAPAGMERRILEAIEDRAIARSRSGWRRFRPIWLVGSVGPVRGRFLAGGVAFAGVLAVVLAVLAIPAIHRLEHAAPQPKSSTSPGSPRPAAASGLVAEVARPQPSGASARPMVKTRVRRAGDLRDSDSVAFQEVPASHPAPPMPLTEQEKLLLRIAHTGDPVELAMLNPEIRARREAQGEAEFKEFFPPPPPIKETADDQL